MAGTEAALSEADVGQPVVADRDMPVRVAKLLRKSGDNLGIDFKILSEGPVTPSVAVQPAPQVNAQALDKMGVTMAGYAKAHVQSTQQESPFIREYGTAGMMLAMPGRDRHDKQMADIAAATPEELQFVLKATYESYAKLLTKEVNMRVDQMIENNPEHYNALLADTSRGRTPAQNRELLIANFRKLDFDEQRDRSMRPDNTPTNLEKSEMNFRSSLRRGFQAVHDGILAHGHVPAYRIAGGRIVSQSEDAKSFAAEANAVGTRQGQRVSQRNRGGHGM